MQNSEGRAVAIAFGFIVLVVVLAIIGIAGIPLKSVTPATDLSSSTNAVHSFPDAPALQDCVAHGGTPQERSQPICTSVPSVYEACQIPFVCWMHPPLTMSCTQQIYVVCGCKSDEQCPDGYACLLDGSGGRSCMVSP